MTLLDLPSTRAEAWRWADLGALSAAAALAPVAAPEHEWLDLPGDRLLFRDGVLDQAASTVDHVTFGDVPAGDHPLGRHARGTSWTLRVPADGTATHLSCSPRLVRVMGTSITASLRRVSFCRRLTRSSVIPA